MREIKLSVPDRQDFAELLNSFESELFKKLDERDRTRQLNSRSEEKKYSTRHEIAAYLRRSLPVIDKYVKAGLPSHLIGGKRLFVKAEVDAYFFERNKKPQR